MAPAATAARSPHRIMVAVSGLREASDRKVSASIRADMKARKGAIPRSKAVGRSTVPAISGCTPTAQASEKTGSMMNQVRNSASETMSMLGGDCCKPMACLRIERTVTMKGKHVTMTASPGARLRTVTSAIKRSDWPVSVWSPRLRVRSCAAAGSADRSRPHTRTAAARIITQRPFCRSATSVSRTASWPACSPSSSVNSPRAISRSPT